ncbi:MAG: bifunctional [glutamate--ammonia ligase]-adenylyl-L-tyrosine phosphorylase/[glutamate--ammonia-ligase] adenylyltransferase [Candidatus Magnetoovum sp. WYHC-5]|nr:bifunctional [glutamate--ammonia ligase]-adenylyl-L-tyrosine phosphorylase/[glutamate--ammonia-ligase] adenylyltransferase [Candidatus Magnetoovum sp. WYHC-5]
MYKSPKELAYDTPDYERAFNNLTAFKEKEPEVFSVFSANELSLIALLFSYSQFLATYAINNPTILVDAIKEINTPVTREFMEVKGTSIDSAKKVSIEAFYKIIRVLKKNFLLLITLRYIAKKTDTQQSMVELSNLADFLIECAYRRIVNDLAQKHGLPGNFATSVVALGKLGARELNYSSDVDIIFIYGTDSTDTDGILTVQGIRQGRLTAHEFYCKVVEEMNKVLSANTADGFVYRVDLRLRPQGQRGQLALPLSGYELYYESWGREWERLALVRARHVAGDTLLGREFIDIVKPFVYRKYIDLTSLNEIGLLKKKIDKTHNSRDIKRGFGGIREIEFFTQALQIVYGGKEPILRERNLLIALHRLQQKNLIGLDDYSILSENYLFLRKLENLIQMVNDIQTHILPNDNKSLLALAKKMGYTDTSSFINELSNYRADIKNIFNSLFQPSNSRKSCDSLEDTPLYMQNGELEAFLQTKNTSNLDKLLYYIKKIRESIGSFQTLRSRKLQECVIPRFVNAALDMKNPETVLNNVLRFVDILKNNASYLETFYGSVNLIDAVIKVFSASPYLSSIIMGHTRYVDMLSSDTTVRKTLQTRVHEIQEILNNNYSPGETFSIYRKSEELRLGMLYLNKVISLFYLIKGLTKNADAVLHSCHKYVSTEDILIVGFGKLGGREITFHSDLDIVFLSTDESSAQLNKDAEKIMRVLSSYTKEGIVYKLDTRLRPEGIKGPLVATLAGLRKYYLDKAMLWEIQALLRARPISGTKCLRKDFLAIKQEVISIRGREFTPNDIRQMRLRIKKTHIKSKTVLDIKLEDGGIEDIEFLVQYLQIKHSIITQSTIVTLKMLFKHGVLSESHYKLLLNNYVFYRNVETFLRLQGEKTLSNKPDLIESLCYFLDFKADIPFIEYVKQCMEQTTNCILNIMD